MASFGVSPKKVARKAGAVRVVNEAVQSYALEIMGALDASRVHPVATTPPPPGDGTLAGHGVIVMERVENNKNQEQDWHSILPRPALEGLERCRSFGLIVRLLKHRG